MCTRTALAERTSSSAISAVDRRCASSSSTSHSRLVSRRCADSLLMTCRHRGSRPWKRSSTRATRVRWMAASPEQTPTSASRNRFRFMVFNKYPSAPARSAAKRSASVSETVSITILAFGSLAEISHAAATPLPGIRTSSRQTSGLSQMAACTAWAASAATAQISNCLVASERPALRRHALACGHRRSAPAMASAGIQRAASTSLPDLEWRRYEVRRQPNGRADALTPARIHRG